MLLDILGVLLLVMLLTILAQILFFIGASFRYFRRRRWEPPAAEDGTPPTVPQPPVSLLVPAYNEEATLANCLDGLAGQTYPHLEVLVISDGSTDATLAIANSYQGRIPGLRVLDKPNGGKASALNHGLAHASGEIIVTVDADSVLTPDAVRNVVTSFAVDDDVVAVAGNVRIANRDTLLGKQQAAEYMTGLSLLRASFAEIGAVQVIPGALGGFRASALRAVGGYATDTLVEDMDLTIELGSRGGKVLYNPHAIAYTEGPSTYRDVAVQRLRWTRGGFQALGKHRHLLFNRDHRWLGMLGLPYFLIAPWFDVILNTLVAATIVLGLLGALPFPWAMLVMGLIAPTLMALYAAKLDRQPLRIAPFYGVMTFILKPFITFVTVRAGVQFLRGTDSGWAKLERTGTNRLPEEELAMQA